MIKTISKTRLAYTSESGIALKVLYRVAPLNKNRLYLQWIIVIPYADALSISDGMKEVALASSNQVSAMEMGLNTQWDCLLIKKM